MADLTGAPSGGATTRVGWAIARWAFWVQGLCLEALSVWFLHDGLGPAPDCGLAGFCLDFRSLAIDLGVASAVLALALAALGWILPRRPGLGWRIGGLVIELPIGLAGTYGILNIAEGSMSTTPSEMGGVALMMGVGMTAIGLALWIGITMAANARTAERA